MRYFTISFKSDLYFKNSLQLNTPNSRTIQVNKLTDCCVRNIENLLKSKDKLNLLRCDWDSRVKIWEQDDDHHHEEDDDKYKNEEDDDDDENMMEWSECSPLLTMHCIWCTFLKCAFHDDDDDDDEDGDDIDDNNDDQMQKLTPHCHCTLPPPFRPHGVLFQQRCLLKTGADIPHADLALLQYNSAFEMEWT